ncbi:MAG: site-specific integrase, partial [Desulfovibrio desulfuricans]|nr:site-specific integrase [Desulfovibrio desulfuricans]
MAHPRTKAPALATLLPLWRDFLLAQRGLSPNTVEAYGQDLESFFLYRQELAQGAAEESLPDPDEQEIFLYLAWLRARQNTGRTLRS